MSEHDEIKNPEQYTWRQGIEPKTFSASNRLLDFEGNVIKYIYRYPKKGGVKDLRKAIENIESLILMENERQSRETT